MTYMLLTNLILRVEDVELFCTSISHHIAVSNGSSQEMSIALLDLISIQVIARRIFLLSTAGFKAYTSNRHHRPICHLISRPRGIW